MAVKTFLDSDPLSVNRRQGRKCAVLAMSVTADGRRGQQAATLKFVIYSS